jgi:dipeptidyl aminopeptidase/acylaminoacyl peptidase
VAGADHPAVSPDGRTLAFTSTQNTVRGWVFPFDPNRGTPPGTGRPVTDEDASIDGLEVDGGGKAIYYIEERPGRSTLSGVRTDLTTGETTVLVADANGPPKPAPDGSGTSYQLYRVPAGGGRDFEYALAWRDRHGRERLLAPWGTTVTPTDVRRDGQAVLGAWTRPAYTGPASLVEWPVGPTPVAQPARVLLEASGKQFWQGRYSPDGRWVSFVVVSLHSDALELGLTPADRDRAPTWIRLAADHPWPDKPRWSPDGRTLYFLSRSPGGFFDLWGVRIDPKRGSPVGAPFRVVEFHSPRWHINPDLGSLEMGVGKGVLALPMRSVKGSIWLLPLGGT